MASPNETNAAAAGLVAAPTGETGEMRIQSVPWSQVYVDGRLVGNTPQMNIVVPTGLHRLQLFNPELDIRYETEVRVEPGQIVTRVFRLPLPGAAVAGPSTSPACPTGAVWSAERGLCSCVHSTPEWDRAQSRCVAAGASGADGSPRSPIPDVASGTLRVDSTPSSQVYVDGRLVGTTPRLNIVVAPGSHTLTLVNTLYQRQETLDLVVEPGETVTRTLRLERSTVSIPAAPSSNATDYAAAVEDNPYR